MILNMSIESILVLLTSPSRGINRFKYNQRKGVLLEVVSECPNLKESESQVSIVGIVIIALIKTK